MSAPTVLSSRKSRPSTFLSGVAVAVVSTRCQRRPALTLSRPPTAISSWAKTPQESLVALGVLARFELLTSTAWKGGNGKRMVVVKRSASVLNESSRVQSRP